MARGRREYVRENTGLQAYYRRNILKRRFVLQAGGKFKDAEDESLPLREAGPLPQRKLKGEGREGKCRCSC
jgi:hypothetical protein